MWNVDSDSRDKYKHDKKWEEKSFPYTHTTFKNLFGCFIILTSQLQLVIFVSGFALQLGYFPVVSVVNMAEYQ